jgi:hypothetical protein
MALSYPPDYSNNHDSTKGYKRMVFRNRKAYTGNDANTYQAILLEKVKALGDAIFNDGDLLLGGVPAIDNATGDVSISAGTIYANGEFFDFNEVTGLTIATDKEVEIGIFLQESIATVTQDPNLVDPSTGLVTSGLETQYRVKQVVEWGWKNTDGSGDSGTDGTFYPVHLASNGVLIIRNEAPTAGIINDAIAQYDVDSSGGYYVVSGLQVLFDELANDKYYYSITNGKARVGGYPISLPSGQQVLFTADPDLSLVQNEVHTQVVAGGEVVIQTNNIPISSVVSVDARLQKTETVTRGVVANTADSVIEGGIYEIVSVTQSANPNSPFVDGTDFQLAGGQVDWSLGGDEPSGGTTYQVTYKFIKTIGIKDGSLENTQFIIEDQDGGNETLINGELCDINYYYKLQRIDLLEIDNLGNLTRVKGASHRSNPTKPIGSPKKLPLATIKHNWYSDPEIAQVSPITVSMGDLNAMQGRINENTLLISELAQATQSRVIETAAQTGIFIDILIDDSQRDLGVTQNLSAESGVLALPVSFADSYPDNVANKSTQSQNYTLEDLVVQEKQTGQIKINPYDVYEAPPKPIIVEQPVNNNVPQFTNFAINYTQPVAQTPIPTPTPFPPEPPSLNIYHGAGLLATAPSDLTEAEAKQIALQVFQDSRNNPNKTSLSKKQEKKVANIATALQAGESPTNVIINKRTISFTVT